MKSVKRKEYIRKYKHTYIHTFIYIYIDSTSKREIMSWEVTEERMKDKI